MQNIVNDFAEYLADVDIVDDHPCLLVVSIETGGVPVGAMTLCPQRIFQTEAV